MIGVIGVRECVRDLKETEGHPWEPKFSKPLFLLGCSVPRESCRLQRGQLWLAHQSRKALTNLRAPGVFLRILVFAWVTDHRILRVFDFWIDGQWAKR